MPEVLNCNWVATSHLSQPEVVWYFVPSLDSLVPYALIRPLVRKNHGASFFISI